MILIENPLKNEILKGLNRYLPKDAHQKSEGGSVRYDLKKTRLLHLGNVEKPHDCDTMVTAAKTSLIRIKSLIILSARF